MESVAGPEAFNADPLVAQILANPEAAPPLAELQRLALSKPVEAASVFERLATSTAHERPVLASRWLTEAAALWSGPAENPKRAARALRGAIDLNPGDERAMAELTRLYRDNGRHQALARLLERRAETLMERGKTDPAALERAAEVFTELGDLLRAEPLNSPVEAIAAYHRAIVTDAAPAATFRAARTLYLDAQQLRDALPLFAMERERSSEPSRLIALYREEAAVRKQAGDTAAASALLRLAWALDPPASDLAEELGRSILGRLEAAEPVPPEEAAEAGDIFAALAETSSGKDLWLAAERCFSAADRWEDAARTAERCGAHAHALQLLRKAAPNDPVDRLRIGLHEARLLAEGLGDPVRAAARYTALFKELPPGCDAAMIERLLAPPHGSGGKPVDVAAKLEAAALRSKEHAVLKIAFELAARALAGSARAAELVRQAEVLTGLGADRALALRHAEVGLDSLSVADAASLLERLAALCAPDEAIDLYERHLARCPTADERAAAVDLAARVAVKKGLIERLQRFFESICAQSTDERALAALERAAHEGDRKRGGTVLRGQLAAALAGAAPDARDAGRTRSAFLRRAARIARRDLGDADQAFEWLSEAMFARVEAALEDALAPLRTHTDELRRSEAAARELRALLERETSRGRSSDLPPPSPPTRPGPARSPTPVPPSAHGAPPAPRAPTPSPPPTVSAAIAPRAAQPASRPPTLPPPPPRAPSRPPTVPPPAASAPPAPPAPPASPPPPAVLAAVPAALAPAPATTPSRASVRSRRSTTPPPPPLTESHDTREPFPPSIPRPTAPLAPPPPPRVPPMPFLAVRNSPPPASPRSATASPPPAVRREARDPLPRPVPHAPLAAVPRLEVISAPEGGRKSRLTGEDLIDDLFESMHALDFCKDAFEGAAFTLKLSMEKLGATAGMVHLYDIDRRQFVVVHAQGPGAERLRGVRTADTEALVDEVMRTQGALILDDGSDPRLSGQRWQTLRSAVEAPESLGAVASVRVAQGGRFLGLIEFAHLAKRPAFAPGDDNALSYIAKRFTEFCAERGVLLSGEE